MKKGRPGIRILALAITLTSVPTLAQAALRPKVYAPGTSRVRPVFVQVHKPMVKSLDLAEELLTVIQPVPQSPSPNSASGSNGRVTINVQGSGTRVVDWGTTVTQYYWDGRLCPSVYLWVVFPNATSNIVDGYDNFGSPCMQLSEGQYGWWSYATDKTPLTFKDGDKLCVTWDPDPPLEGTPCILIKK